MSDIMELVGRLRAHADTPINDNLEYIKVADDLMRSAASTCERLEEALSQYERLLLVNAVRESAENVAPLWLEAAERAREALEPKP